ncbi:MAG TPA: hypothetical protein ENG22_05030, partial [Candidatus Bathyarchaeota archaeon]|nr:hypothetical protein [Candidatus Bathyarchaeota archaeon]
STLLVPLFLVLFYGFMFGKVFFGGTEITLNIGVVNLDQGVQFAGNFTLNLGEYFKAMLLNTSKTFNETDGRSRFTLKVFNYSTIENATRAFENGTIDGFIVIPENFTLCLISNESISIYAYGDPSDYVKYSTFTSICRELAISFSLRGRPIVGVEEKSLTIKRKTFTYFDISAPGMILFGLLFVTTSSAHVFASEREHKLIDRIVMSGLSPSEIILGAFIAMFAVAFLQSMLCFSAALTLKACMVGSIPEAIVVILCMAMFQVALGLLVSIYAKNTKTAENIAWMIVAPIMFLGGIWWPIEWMAEPFKTIGKVFPPSMGCELLRAIMLKGATIFSEKGLITITSLIALSIAMLIAEIYLAKKHIFKPR